MKTRLLIYTLLGLIMTMVMLFGGLVARQGLTETAVEADYMNFLLGGSMLAQGHAAASELYDTRLQSRIQVAMVTPISAHRFHDNVLPFVSVPLVAALAKPLTTLPLAAGFIIWNGVQLAALLLSLWLLNAMLPAQYRYLLCLGAFSFLPVYQSFIEGQVSPTLLLGVTLLWRGLRIGGAGNWWGGMGLALCLLKPQVLPLFLLYLLYKRNWQALAGFIGTSGLVYMLSVVISGWGWPGPYIGILNWLGSQGDRAGALVMFNLIGLLARFGISSPALLYAITIIVVGGLVYAWWHSDRATNPALSQDGIEAKREYVDTLELQLAATTIAAVLTSLHLYTHDLTMLLFSGAALLGWGRQQCWPGAFSALLLIALLTPFTFFSNLPIDSVFILVMLGALGALIYIMTQMPAPGALSGIKREAGLADIEDEQVGSIADISNHDQGSQA